MKRAFTTIIVLTLVGIIFTGAGWGADTKINRPGQQFIGSGDDMRDLTPVSPEARLAARGGRAMSAVRLAGTAAAEVWVDGSYTAATPGWGTTAFATIAGGITAVDAGGIVHIAAGIYAENIVITKAVTLLGPNEAINPNTGSRVAEAVLMTAVAGAYQNSGDPFQTIIEILASNVTIKGLAFDGNNPALTSGVLSNGVDIDAASAILSDEGVGGIVIENNIITGFSYSALEFYNYVSSGAVTTGNYFRNNAFDNIMPASWGIGILIYNNFYAEITGNVLTRTRVGIQTGNFYRANTGSTQSISNNAIQTSRYGIFFNLMYADCSTFTVANNTITAVAGFSNSRGMLVSSIQGTTSVDLLNNTITGLGIGINFWNNPTTNTVTVTGGLIDACGIGIRIDNYDGYSSDGLTTVGGISGVTISNCTVAGIQIKDNKLNANGATVSGNILAGTVLTGNAVDVMLDGLGVAYSSAVPGVTVGYAGIVTVSAPAGTYATIQAAIDAANPGATITAAEGTFTEDVNVNKAITLRGAGIDKTIIVGPKGGDVNTIMIGTSGSLIEGFTITREGNSVADWTLATLNNQGVNFGQLTTGNILQKCKLTGNRNSIYINNSQGNIVRENVITFNRTGIQLVNNVSNTVIQNNDITENWTLGFVLYYNSAGQPATSNLMVSGNNVSGNWHGQIDCKTVSSIANPTAAYNFSGNWFGTNALSVTSSPAGEPGYDVQIPAAYGGSATNPGTGAGRISGDLVAMVDYSPWLEVGTDTAPATIGFQGDLSAVRVSPTSPVSGAVARIQEGVDLVTGSTIRLLAGTYTEGVNLNKPNLTLIGAGRATTIINIAALATSSNGAGVDATANNVTIKDLTVQGSSTAARYGIQFSNAAVLSGAVENVTVQNCYRTGINMNGAKNVTLTNVAALNNGGNGLQMGDAENVTMNGITTSGNAWGGVGIFVWGRYYPRGTSGIVIQGTNSFGESVTGQGALYLESADWANPTVPGTISFSTNPSDHAQVTLSASDFGFAVSGPQETESTNSAVYSYTRMRFYQTLDQAKAFAGLAGIAAHMLPVDRYLCNVADYAGPRTFRVFDFAGDLMSIKAAIAAASNGDLVTVDAGTYVEGPQVVVNANVSVTGANKNTVIITPSANTGGSGDARGWFLVNPGKTFNLSGVTLDGAGKLVNIGILSKGPGTISGNILKNIGYNPSGPDYAGRGIAFYEANMTISDNSLSNIGRIGIYMYGAGVTNGSVANNTYTGKGTGDWLDYGVEVEGGAHGVLTGNTVTECKGVASVDGSTSAGVLATTYWAAGTQVNASDNTFTNNTTGVAIGYAETDVTVSTVTGNDLTGCEYGVTSTGPVSDARRNWWGAGSGPSGGVSDPVTAALANGTGAQVSTHVRFDPWSGKSEIVNVPSPGTYSWPESGVTMTFGTVPSGGGTVTVQRLLGTPPNPPYPVPPAGATYIPLWLMLSSSMPNYSFSATVTVDVSDIAGFGAASQVMYLNSATNTWVPVGGTYDAMAHTFTFTTTHFTPFAFVNTPATAFQLYLSSNTSASSSGIYPNNTWAMPSPLPANYPNPPRAGNDWGYTSTQTLDVYIVPEAGTPFGAADLTLEWDPALLAYSAVSFNGSVFASGGNTLYAIADQLGTNNRVRINASLTSPNNVTAVAGNYIAKLTLRTLTPGHSAVTVIASDLRKYEGAGAPLGVYVTPHQADIRAYLGDVANIAGDSSADGQINFSDLNPWATTYWSGVPGYANGMTYYKVKCDIGPTADHYVFSAPQVDGKIDFEDLIIFSISYGLSANHQLPKKAVEQSEPVTVAVGDVKAGGGETRVPVMLDGTVNDLRGIALTLSGTHGRLLGVEKGALLSGYETPVPVMSCERDGKVYVDLAIAGLNAEALKTAGELVVLRFEGKAAMSLVSAEARTSTNAVLETKLRTPSVSDVPAEFALQQNYPNPFNPSTTVSYALPSVSDVRIAVYNVLGEEVATLMNGVQEAGYYTVQWNGTDGRGQHVTSGVYFLTMRAGEFTAMKKMMFVK
jgi:parallel beta-helix repeat protein